MSTFDPLAQVSTYLDNVPSYNQTPKFLQILENVLSAFAQIQKVALDLQDTTFDVDSAIGAQLDIVGLWVGISRQVDVEVLTTYFSFDTLNAGFDQGIWFQTGDSTTGVVLLTDDIYRALIKAKIALNTWDGTNSTLKGVFDALVAAYAGSVALWVQDNLNKTITVNTAAYLPTGAPDVLTALLTDNIFVVKPMGMTQIVHSWKLALIGFPSSGATDPTITYPQDGVFRFNSNWSTAFYQSSDEGTFLYTQISGDFALECVVMLPNGATSSGNPQVGLFVRDEITQNGCIYAAATISLDLTAQLVNVRTADFSTTYPNTPDNQVQSSALTQTFVYLRITRTGSAFSLDYSTDGVTWTANAYNPSSVPTNLYIGAFCTDNGATTDAYVSSVTLK